MARYLFTCHDAGGTVPPVLSAAHALVERGHEVTILSQPSVEARARALGCAFQPFSETDDYRRDVALEEQLDRSIPALVGPSVGVDLLAAAQATGADALVVDPNLSGALAAAESLELPSAVLLHSMFRTFVDVWFGELWGLLAEPINATRRGFGVDAAASWADMLGRHDLILSPVPAVFDAQVGDTPQAVRHVGFLVPPDPQGRRVELPAGDGPVVAVSFSTTYQRQERLIADTVAALADENVRMVVTTSGYASASASAAGRAPANALITDFVPHVALFACADLVITHGGLGTTAAALDAGVPLVCVPMGRDQTLNAERVAALGAGVSLTADAGGSSLRDATRAVLSGDSYREAAEAIGAASRAVGRAGAAADALEGLVAAPE